MKAIIKLDVPEWQIGRDVTVYFPDTMLKHGVCEAVKITPKPERLLPCTCGCKRREHWFGCNGSENARILKCMKCGFTIGGQNEIDVHKKWNDSIRRQTKTA